MPLPAYSCCFALTLNHADIDQLEGTIPSEIGKALAWDPTYAPATYAPTYAMAAEEESALEPEPKSEP